MPTITIQICMGSSCHSRGNAENLAAIQNYIAERDLEDDFEIVGNLCQGHCKKGPNIVINGETQHSVTPASINKILDLYLAEKEGQ